MTTDARPDPSVDSAASPSTVLAEGHELATLYDEAVKDLNRHWPDENGECIGCGDTYPCAEEWITQRAITGIETRWRHQSHLLANLTPAPGTATPTPASNPADQPPPEGEPT
jgi:hypothetical protein